MRHAPQNVEIRKNFRTCGPPTRSTETLAEIKVQVPATADLRAVLSSLRADGEEVYVTDLADKATIVVRKRVPRIGETERAESELRLSVAERLKAAGVLGQ